MWSKFMRNNFYLRAFYRHIHFTFRFDTLISETIKNIFAKYAHVVSFWLYTSQ